MKPAANDELNFEQALAELERIVRDLEEGRSGLEESLAHYESGVALLKRCHEQLQQAEQRIALLTGMDAEGNPVTRPFAHAASTEKPEAAAKPRREPVEPKAPAKDESKPKPTGGLLWE